MPRSDGEDAEVPSPELVAAWLVFGQVRQERAPWWAAQWLVDGHDGEALRDLAGLNERDVYAITDLLPVALEQMGVVQPVSVTEAASAVFDDLARRCLASRIGERRVAQMVEEVVRRVDFSPDVLDLPLGGTYGVDDAWTGGWGPSVTELGQQVRAACVEQLRRAET